MLNKKGILLFVFSVMTAGSVATTASACPLIAGLVDFNCDGTHKIAITGDSIVKGIGDEENGNNGGYVLRLKKHFPNSSIENIGIPGITSRRLLKAFKDRLTSAGPNLTKQKTFGADIFIIDVGRNDYWNKENPARTVRTLQRLVNFISSYDRKNTGSSSLFFISTLLPTNREFQEPFIQKLNALLIKSRNSKNFPVTPLFGKLGRELLSADGLHPNSQGYAVIAKATAKFIKGKVEKLSRSLRKDQDRDGIYDAFELSKFGTDPMIKDTDLDGVTDGKEVFVTFTDPLMSDEPVEPEENTTPAPTKTPIITPTPVFSPTASEESPEE